MIFKENSRCSWVRNAQQPPPPTRPAQGLHAVNLVVLRLI